MINHVGFEPPELCECCEESYQYRNGLCFDCWIDGQDRRGEERHDREVIERQQGHTCGFLQRGIGLMSTIKEHRTQQSTQQSPN